MTLRIAMAELLADGSKDGGEELFVVICFASSGEVGCISQKSSLAICLPRFTPEASPLPSLPRKPSPGTPLPMDCKAPELPSRPSGATAAPRLAGLVRAVVPELPSAELNPWVTTADRSLRLPSSSCPSCVVVEPLIPKARAAGGTATTGGTATGGRGGTLRRLLTEPAPMLPERLEFGS